MKIFLNFICKDIRYDFKIFIQISWLGGKIYCFQDLIVFDLLLNICKNKNKKGFFEIDFIMVDEVSILFVFVVIVLIRMEGIVMTIQFIFVIQDRILVLNVDLVDRIRWKYICYGISSKISSSISFKYTFVYWRSTDLIYIAEVLTEMSSIFGFVIVNGMVIY